MLLLPGPSVQRAEPPAPDEGFDEVHSVRIAPVGEFTVDAAPWETPSSRS